MTDRLAGGGLIIFDPYLAIKIFLEDGKGLLLYSCNSRQFVVMYEMDVERSNKKASKIDIYGNKKLVSFILKLIEILDGHDRIRAHNRTENKFMFTARYDNRTLYGCLAVLSIHDEKSNQISKILTKFLSDISLDTPSNMLLIIPKKDSRIGFLLLFLSENPGTINKKFLTPLLALYSQSMGIDIKFIQKNNVGEFLKKTLTFSNPRYIYSIDINSNILLEILKFIFRRTYKSSIPYEKPTKMEYPLTQDNTLTKQYLINEDILLTEIMKLLHKKNIALLIHRRHKNAPYDKNLYMVKLLPNNDKWILCDTIHGEFEEYLIPESILIALLLSAKYNRRKKEDNQHHSSSKRLRTPLQ